MKHDLLPVSSVVLLENGARDHDNAMSHKTEQFIGTVQWKSFGTFNLLGTHIELKTQNCVWS